MTDYKLAYVPHRLRNIRLELAHISGDIVPVGRGKVAQLSLTRAMTEIECALRHLDAMPSDTVPDAH